MKRYYPALFALVGSVSLSAQIQITSVLMPVVGDELTNYRDTLPSFGPGGNGPAQVWDFSAAQLGTTAVTTFVDPATTPNADQFGSSNLAMSTDGLNFSYMTNGSNLMTVDGFSGDPLGDGSLVIAAPFDPVMTLHQFPRQYTTAFTDDFGFDVTADGSSFGVYLVRVRDVSTVYDTTDGYGTITTPVGTYDCLRSRLTTIRTDSIFVQLIQLLPMSFFQTMVDTSVTYVWHAVETKLPVAEMNVDSLGQATSFTWSAILPNSTAVQGSTSPKAGLSLYPQPAADQVRVTSDAALLSVGLSDLTGKSVLRNERLSANDILDLSAIPAGTYVVNAVAQDGRRFSQRLIHVNPR